MIPLRIGSRKGLVTRRTAAQFNLSYRARIASPYDPPAYAPQFSLGLTHGIQCQAIRSRFRATTLTRFSRTSRPIMPGNQCECRGETAVAQHHSTPPRERQTNTASTNSPHDHTGHQSPPPIVSHISVSSLLTLRLQLFSVFVHTTSSLSVLEPYLALRVEYPAICTAFPNYATRQ
jgi:hypothetical protein